MIGRTISHYRTLEKPINYVHGLLIAFDQLGNALAGGYPDTTISARVGFFAKKETIWKPFWRSMEAIINFTFRPMNGPDHCHNVYLADPYEHFHEGSDLLRIILTLFVLIFCFILATLFYLITFLIPPLSWERLKSKK